MSDNEEYDEYIETDYIDDYDNDYDNEIDNIKNVDSIIKSELNNTNKKKQKGKISKKKNNKKNEDEEEENEEEENEDEENEDENEDEDEDNIIIEEEDEYIDNNELISVNKIENIVHPNNRITSQYLSRYEYSKIIGIRAEQISQGSKVFVNTDNMNDPIEMAKKELYENKTPLSIKRYIGLTKYEIWSVNELIKKSYQ